MKTAVAAPLQWEMLMEKWVGYQTSVLGLLQFLQCSWIGVGLAGQAAALLAVGSPVGRLQVLRIPLGLCPLLLRFPLAVQRGKVTPALGEADGKAVVCWVEASPEGRQMSKSKLGGMNSIRTPSCMSTRGPCRLGLEAGMHRAGHEASLLSDQTAPVNAQDARYCEVSNRPSRFPQVSSDSLARLGICKSLTCARGV